jgi:hypothetical protein
VVFEGSVSLDKSSHVAQLIPPEVTEVVSSILIKGDLHVAGTLSNYVHPNGRRDMGLNLVVLGNLHASSLISTNAAVFVAKDCIFDEAMYVYYDNGTTELRVDGTLRGKGLLVNDEHSCRIEQFDCTHDIDLYNVAFEEVERVILEDYVSDEASKIEHHAVIAALEAGKPIFV